MEPFFLAVVTVSLTTSAVLLPLLLLADRLQRRYAARTFWVIWFLLALRLAVPVGLGSAWAPLNVDAPAYTVVLPAVSGETAGGESGGAQVMPGPSEAGRGGPALSLTTLAALAWAAVGGALLLVRTAGYPRARRALLRSAQPAPEAIREVAQAAARAVGLKRRVPVCLHPRLGTPMAVGLFRPVVVLPADLGPAQREAALRHEFCHIRRRDVAGQLLLLWVTALHWFNPLVWWMSRAARRNLELCCDDDVLRGQDSAFRRRYGELLLAVADRSPGIFLSTRFSSGGELLRRRLENLFAHRRRGRFLIVLVLAATLAAGTLVACGETSPDDPLEALKESIHYDGAQVSFTLPESDQDWEIQIAGRAEFPSLGGMSLHYLDDVQWRSGECYTFAVDAYSASRMSELTMWVWLGEEEGEIDLLPYLQGAEGQVTVMDGLPWVYHMDGGWTTLSQQTVPTPAEWAAQDLGGRNEAQSLPDTGIFTGRMVSEREGWLTATYGAGVAHADNYVYRTEDGGQTWTEVTKPEKIGFYLSAVGFLDRRRLILAGQLFEAAPCLITFDGGVSWTEIALPDPYAQVNAIQASEERVVLWVSRSGGEPVWRMTSTDGGARWTTEALGEG